MLDIVPHDAHSRLFELVIQVYRTRNNLDSIPLRQAYLNRMKLILDEHTLPPPDRDSYIAFARGERIRIDEQLKGKTKGYHLN